MPNKPDIIKWTIRLPATIDLRVRREQLKLREEGQRLSLDNICHDGLLLWLDYQRKRRGEK